LPTKFWATTWNAISFNSQEVVEWLHKQEKFKRYKLVILLFKIMSAINRNSMHNTRKKNINFIMLIQKNVKVQPNALQNVGMHISYRRNFAIKTTNSLETNDETRIYICKY